MRIVNEIWLLLGRQFRLVDLIHQRKFKSYSYSTEEIAAVLKENMYIFWL